MLEQLHKESFAECVNQNFRVTGPQAPDLELKLTQVTEQIRTPRQEGFSVMFRGPADRFLPQGTHHVSNEKLGELDIFLVPIAHDNEGYQYEAIFNYLIPSA